MLDSLTPVEPADAAPRHVLFGLEARRRLGPERFDRPEHEAGHEEAKKAKKKTKKKNKKSRSRQEIGAPGNIAARQTGSASGTTEAEPRRS